VAGGLMEEIVVNTGRRSGKTKDEKDKRKG